MYKYNLTANFCFTLPGEGIASSHRSATVLIMILRLRYEIEEGITRVLALDINIYEEICSYLLMLTLGTLTMLLLAARSTIVHPWILTTPICGRYIHSSTALFSTDDGKASASSSSSPDSTPKRSRKPANLSRFRQHVNPLASRYQQSLVSPSASTITDAFSDPSKPVHLDVGCAKGTFILEMSALDPDTNYLGLEIRPPVVEFALERLTRRSLTNCHFIEVRMRMSEEQSDELKRRFY